MEGGWRSLCGSAARSNDLSSEQIADTAPEQELARAKARANLLLVLYSHVTQDLEQSRRESDRLRSDLADAHRAIQRLDDEVGQRAAGATELQHRQTALLG